MLAVELRRLDRQPEQHRLLDHHRPHLPRLQLPRGFIRQAHQVLPRRHRHPQVPLHLPLGELLAHLVQYRVEVVPVILLRQRQDWIRRRGLLRRRQHRVDRGRIEEHGLAALFQQRPNEQSPVRDNVQRHIQPVAEFTLPPARPRSAIAQPPGNRAEPGGQQVLDPVFTQIDQQGFQHARSLSANAGRFKHSSSAAPMSAPRCPAGPAAAHSNRPSPGRSHATKAAS